MFYAGRGDPAFKSKKMDCRVTPRNDEDVHITGQNINNFQLVCYFFIQYLDAVTVGLAMFIISLKKLKS